MSEFLNKFTAKNRKQSAAVLDAWTQAFKASIGVLADAIGQNTFRPESTINAAVFDAVMVGVARRLKGKPLRNLAAVKQAYDSLLANAAFMSTVSRSTADDKLVASRIQMATEAFATIP
jgi:hypothetical protein